jgi:tetratricopeptide (TPR) repeat protein
MIGSVKHTFAVLLPWAKSALYADKWCLFELYLSSIHECRLTVAIPQADAEKIDDQMLGPKARELGEEFAAVDFGGAKLTPPSLAVDLGSAAAIDALAVKTLKSNENKVENEKKGISDAVMYKRVNIEIIDSLKRWLDQRIEQVIDEALDLLEELVHDANKSFAEGRMEEAEGLFQRSYDGCSILLGPEHEDTLAVQHEFGVICKKANNLQKAEDMLQAAVTGREKAIGKDNLETINSVMMLAEVKHLRGSLQESEALYERAMKSVAKEFGEKHELYLACLQAIAALHVERGRADEAEASLRRVMEALHAAHGPDHPDTLAATHALAVFYSERDMNDAAEPLYKTAYEGRARTLGEADAGTLVSMSALAETYRKLGRTAEAEDVYRRLIPLSERAFGSTHADTLSSCNNLASILSDRGEIVDAERFYRQAYDGRLKTIGPEHPRTLGTMNNLAVLLINTKDPAKKQEGEKLLLEVLERREKALGMSNRDTCATATYLAGHFKDTQRYAAAEALYRDVVDGRIEDVGLYNSQTLHAVTNLALMLTVMDKLKEADEEYARALDIHDRLNAKDDPGRLKVMSNYGALLVHKKDYEKAEVIYKEVVTQREQSLGPDDQQTLKSVYVLGTVSE